MQGDRHGRPASRAADPAAQHPGQDRQDPGRAARRRRRQRPGQAWREAQLPDGTVQAGAWRCQHGRAHDGAGHRRARGRAGGRRWARARLRRRPAAHHLQRCQGAPEAAARADHRRHRCPRQLRDRAEEGLCQPAPQEAVRDGRAGDPGPGRNRLERQDTAGPPAAEGDARGRHVQPHHPPGLGRRGRRRIERVAPGGLRRGELVASPLRRERQPQAVPSTTPTPDGHRRPDRACL